MLPSRSLKDIMANSVSTPFSESEKGTSKEDDRSQIDFALLQNNEAYFSSLDKLQKNAKKVKKYSFIFDLKRNKI